MSKYLDRLIREQEKIMRDELPTIGYSADGRDYYYAAKTIKRRLENIKTSKDPLRSFARLIQDLPNYACDGICDSLDALYPDEAQ